MTNKKFKHASEYRQMQIALIVATRNLMTMYCCLNKQGVTRKKVVALDEKLLTEYVPECKKDANDDVLLIRAKRFIQQVGMDWKQLCDITIEMSLPYLADGKYSRDQLLRILQSLAEDIAMYLKLLHSELGYGKVRLERVTDAMRSYRGDALKEAESLFGFDYGDMSVLPTIDDTRKPIVDKETAAGLRNLMAGR